LKMRQTYPSKKQSKIIIAYMTLHNFFQKIALSDKNFDKCDQDESYMLICHHKILLNIAVLTARLDKIAALMPLVITYVKCFDR
jgi:hypothetical protein